MWQALKADPTLTVVEGIALPSERDSDSGFRPLRFEDLHYDDETMTPLDIEVREPRTGTVVPLTVIGVLDRVHESFEEFNGMLVSKTALDDVIPFPIPITTYQFRVADGADTDQIAKVLEASFLQNGMDVDPTSNSPMMRPMRSWSYSRGCFVALCSSCCRRRALHCTTI